MFDARSILDALVKGGAPAQGGQSSGLGSLGDILGQLGQAAGQGGRASAAPQGGGGLGGLGDILGQLGQAMGQGGGTNTQGGQGGGLGDILKNMLPGADQQASAAPPRQAPAPTPAPRAPRAAQPQDQDDDSDTSGATSPGDILRKIQDGLGKAGQGGGSLIDVLGQILGQASQGVREGAGRINDATGASGQLKDVLGKATGKSPDEILAQLKELIDKNQLGAGAIAGGLGSILLGTQAGRSLAAHAIKLGGLALIGGLAYKALMNYQQGKPPIAVGQSSKLVEAPAGSGFEAEAVSHDNALLLIRGMIAAAAADGRIDEKEQTRILGSLQQGNLGADAEEFLANELNNPATVDELVQSVHNEAEAVQLFTAARVAVDLKDQ
ncbi:MAG: DUF533 domain-containing protein, partial [Proteobacteria bacterium]|nr:DUF533 domain-containing protein [Pseudomonadota bacterium]